MSLSTKDAAPPRVQEAPPHPRTAFQVRSALDFVFVDGAPRPARRFAPAIDPIVDVVVGGETSVQRWLARHPVARPRLAVVTGAGHVDGVVCVPVADMPAALQACRVLASLARAPDAAGGALDAHDVAALLSHVDGAGSGAIVRAHGASLVEAARSAAAELAGRAVRCALLTLTYAAARETLPTYTEALRLLVPNEDPEVVLALVNTRAPCRSARVEMVAVVG